MSNPFDQFDAPAEKPAAAAPVSAQGVNPFDQFDSTPAPNPKDFAAVAQAEFDKGATREQMDKLAVDHGLKPFGKDLDFALEARSQGLKVQMQAPDPKPYSVIQSMNDGVLKVVNNVGRAIEQIPGVTDLEHWTHDHFGMADSIDAAEQAQNAARDASGYRSGDAGKFAGEMIATAPTLLVGSPVAAGALSGALTTDKRTLAGVAQDAALGGVAGKLGDTAVRAGARVIAPIAQPLGKNVQKLIGEGITAITPGQVARDAGGVTNKLIATAEDRSINRPIVGALVQNDRAVATDQLNRAVANRALKPIGETLPDSVATGHDAVTHVGDRLIAAYQDVLPKLNGTIDPAFQRRLGTIIARAQLPQTVADKVTQLMTETGHAFSLNPGAVGTYSGKTLRNATDKLDKLAVGWGKSDDPYVSQLGDIAGQFKQELLSLAQRQNPAEADALRGINKGYAILVRLEGAAKNAKGGVFSPGQLTTAVRTADRTVRKRAVGRGQALLQDLSDAASQVMPSTNPDSGTAANLTADTILGNVKGAARSLAYVAAKRDLGRSLTAGPQSRYIADLLRKGAPAVGQASAIEAPDYLSNSIYGR